MAEAVATPEPAQASSNQAPAEATDADAFSALDSMIAEPLASPQASAAAEKVDTTAPKPETAPEAAAKPPAQAPKPEATKPVQDAPPKPVKAKTLAEAKERAENAEKEWKGKFQALEREMQNRPKPEDPEPLKTRIADLEKHLAQAQDDLKYVNYESTQDYANKNKQFLEAYNRGRSFVERLDVVERRRQIQDPNSGEAKEQVVQQARKAKAEDFDALMRLYHFDPASGSRLANQLFGDLAPDVKDYAREIQRHFEDLEAAKAEYRDKAVERQKVLVETAKAANESLGKAFNDALAVGPQKWPERYGPKEGDAKGNELLTKGMSLAHRAFTDGKAFTEGDKDLSPQELARLRAAVANMAGAHPRALYWNKQLQSKVAELEKELAQYRDSEPGPDTGRRTKGAKQFNRAMDEALDSLGSIATTDSYAP